MKNKRTRTRQAVFFVGTWLAMSLFICISNPITHAADVCTQSTGTLIDGTYFSQPIQQEMNYRVYLPPCYTSDGNPYPIIYLMHGSNRDHTQWTDRLNLAQALDEGISTGTFPPVIVAMPHGSWIANENRFEGEATWSNIFLTEFMPEIENQYHVSDQRAIGGISRGGFWAFNIAFRFPELFQAVGGHSPFFDPGHYPAEYNPLNLAETAPNIDTLRIMLDRGADDYAWYGMDLMHDALTTRGIEHEYTVNANGTHEDDYWSAHVMDYLSFYTADWQTPVELPIIQHEFDLSGTVNLYTPAAAFSSVRVSVDSQRLLRIYAGLPDFDLILSRSTAEALNIDLHPITQIVDDDALTDALWANPELYTLLPITALTPRLRPLWVDDMPLLDNDLTQYPFVFPGDDYNPASMTRILFSGVTALGRFTREAFVEHGVEWAASGIQDYVLTPDYFHTSNEVSFHPLCPNADQDVIGGLCAMDEHFPLFDLLDVDIMELTGNHNNDYGFDAYRRTFEMYQQVGIATIGGGETLDQARQPLIIEHHNSTIGLLACNWNGPDFALVTDSQPGAAYCTLDWLQTAIPALAAETDVLIVTVQYAEYNQHQPIERQTYHFQLLADLGADVVIGTQAHLPQTFEFYSASDGRDVFIHYGMGNLFFDQLDWATMRFFMDQLYIYDGRLLGVELFPGIIDDRARPRPMTASERNAFMRLMMSESGF